MRLLKSILILIFFFFYFLNNAFYKMKGDSACRAEFIPNEQLGFLFEEIIAD